jgi:hypothetical protein
MNNMIGISRPKPHPEEHGVEKNRNEVMGLDHNYKILNIFFHGWHGWKILYFMDKPWKIQVYRSVQL